MRPAPDRAAPPPPRPGSPAEPAPAITRRLTAAGLTVHATQQHGRHQLIILDITPARCCLTLTGDGYSQWHYEPAAGAATSAASLTAIITHILGAPHAAGTTPDADPCRAFPLKGIVGRCLQDRGLTVALKVCEDPESFEATTDIEVTSPARPWLGTVRLSDNGHIEWDCDARAAFHGDPGALIDVIAPVIRAAFTWTEYFP